MKKKIQRKIQQRILRKIQNENFKYNFSLFSSIILLFFKAYYLNK
jgi:hypothetical protein